MNTELVNRSLSGPEYFRCERLSCTLLKSACVERRKTRKEKGWKDPLDAFSCDECDQGEEIVKQIGRTVKVCTKCRTAKTIDNFHVQAGGRYGRTSVCKECQSEYMAKRYIKQNGDKSMEEPRVVNDAGMEIFKKVCTHCGQEKSLDEFSVNKLGSLGRNASCKECKRKYIANLRASKKEQKANNFSPAAIENSAERRNEHCEKPIVDYRPIDLDSKNVVVTLNFSGYENVLNWLIRTAAENFRNPDQQALFVLHQLSTGNRA